MAGAEPCALVLQDMNFSRRTSGDEGLELLRRIRETHPLLPVILITAWGSISLAVAGMRLGAADFVTKPWTNPALLQAVQTALRLAGTANGHDVAPITREDLDASYDFDAIVSADARMLKLLQLVGRVAATDASVLITGESGTGKELIADALHRNSHRRKKPFVKVNLGGISASLFESEMFGHVRGAFTDARHDRQGRFELADGGTIFLDEIGDLDRVVAGQVAARAPGSDLRGPRLEPAADRRRARGRGDQPRLGRHGATRRVPRGPAVSHQPDHGAPAGAARAPGRHPAARPPLRAGPRATPGRESLVISPAAVKWLQALPWPGNIRQLKQWIERAALVTPGQVLDVDDFRATSEMEAPARGPPTTRSRRSAA